MQVSTMLHRGLCCPQRKLNPPATSHLHIAPAGRPHHKPLSSPHLRFPESIEQLKLQAFANKALFGGYE